MIDLITGATGFFGYNLVKTLLLKGNKVRIVIRSLAKSNIFKGLEKAENLEIFEGDVSDPASIERATEGIRYVYHAAAIVSSWPGLRDQAFKTNYEGLINVFEACKKNKVSRLIYISTVDAYGLDFKTNVANEDTKWNYKELGLNNPYSESKYLAQKYVLDHASELDCVSVCPGFMLGPNDLQLSSNRLLLLVATGKLKIATVGGNSFVHVQDVVDFSIRLSQEGKSGREYIVASENLSYGQFFALILEQNKKPIKFVTFPAWLSTIAAFFGSIYGHLSRKEPDLHLNTIKLSNTPHYYSSERARTELGFKPRPVSEAVLDSLNDFKVRGLLKN